MAQHTKYEEAFIPTASEEEMKFAEKLWRDTQEKVSKGESDAAAFWATITWRYPKEKVFQIRSAGWLNELYQRYPDGNIPKDEAINLSEKWGIPHYEIRYLREPVAWPHAMFRHYTNQII